MTKQVLADAQGPVIRLPVICAVCNVGFTSSEWLHRHTESLHRVCDVHADCCTLCHRPETPT